MIGILGGGQLGRMMVLAGKPLGLDFRVLDSGEHVPTDGLAGRVRADFADAEAVDRFAEGLTHVTYEFENVPVATTRRLADRLPVFPPPLALATAQDRREEKTLFDRIGLPTPPWTTVDSAEQLRAGCDRIGLPAVLKTRRGGYDGKGQRVLRTDDDLSAAWDDLGGRPLLLEAMVDFGRELSMVAVRGAGGQVAFYPLTENRHTGGILDVSVAPAPDADRWQPVAEGHLRRLTGELDYVGVLAVEFFDCGDRLLGNEMAPRVHNSGHWTIEGAACSQFENHLRAGLGWPLGSTAAVGESAMVNLIGEVPDVAELLAVPGAHLHLYGKTPRPGRKLGHVTVAADRLSQVRGALRDSGNGA